MKFFQSISTRLFITILLAMAVVGGSLFYSFQKSAGALTAQIDLELVTVNQLYNQQIQIYLDQLEFNAELIASIPNVQSSYFADVDEQVLADATSVLKQVDENDDAILHIDMIDLEGLVFNSSLEEKIGGDKSESSVFLEGKTKTFYNSLHISSSAGVPAFGVSVPVKVDGKVVGVLLVDLKADKIMQILSNSSELNSSIELYLVDNTGLMNNSSEHYPEETFLTKEVNSHVYEGCFKGEATPSNRSIYNNYRDLSVLSVNSSIPSLNLCLISEMRKETVLDEVMNTILTSFAISLGLSVAIMSMVWLFSLVSISQPIVKLTKAITAISTGNMQANIDSKVLKSQDELGDLARSFERVWVSLKLAMRQKSQNKLEDNSEDI